MQSAQYQVKVVVSVDSSEYKIKYLAAKTRDSLTTIKILTGLTVSSKIKPFNYAHYTI